MEKEQVFTDLATGLVVECNKHKEVKKLDPMTILAIVSLLKAGIDLYVQCKKNDWHLFEDVKKMSGPLGYFKRRKLRNMAKKHCPKEDPELIVKELPGFILANKEKVSSLFI